jgi:hypothetical protein
MSLAPASWFFRCLLARKPALKMDDPANMGTAFGLEASLGPVGADPDGEGKRVTTQAGAPGDESPMGWLGRRITRHR